MKKYHQISIILNELKFRRHRFFDPIKRAVKQREKIQKIKTPQFAQQQKSSNVVF